VQGGKLDGVSPSLTNALPGPTHHAPALAARSSGGGAAERSRQIPSDEWAHAKVAVRTKVGASKGHPGLNLQVLCRVCSTSIPVPEAYGAPRAAGPVSDAMRVAVSPWHANEPLPYMMHMMQRSAHNHTKHACTRAWNTLTHARTHPHACVCTHVCLQSRTHLCARAHPMLTRAANTRRRRQGAAALFILSRWPWTAAPLRLQWSAGLTSPPRSACHSRGTLWARDLLVRGAHACMPPPRPPHAPSTLWGPIQPHELRTRR